MHCSTNPKSTSRPAINGKNWIHRLSYLHFIISQTHTFGITNTTQSASDPSICGVRRSQLIVARMVFTGYGCSSARPEFRPGTKGKWRMCVNCVALLRNTHIFILAKYEINIPTYLRWEQGARVRIIHAIGLFAYLIIQRIANGEWPGCCYSCCFAYSIIQYSKFIMISCSSVRGQSKEILSMGYRDVSQNHTKRRSRKRTKKKGNGIFIVSFAGYRSHMEAFYYVHRIRIVCTPTPRTLPPEQLSEIYT